MLSLPPLNLYVTTGLDFICLQDQPCPGSKPLLPDGHAVCAALAAISLEMCQPQVDP